MYMIDLNMIQTYHMNMINELGYELNEPESNRHDQHLNLIILGFNKLVWSNDMHVMLYLWCKIKMKSILWKFK